MKETKIKIELTQEEAKVVEEYLFKKVVALETAGLTDSYCYPKLLKVHVKLKRELSK